MVLLVRKDARVLQVSPVKSTITEKDGSQYSGRLGVAVRLTRVKRSESPYSVCILQRLTSCSVISTLVWNIEDAPDLFVNRLWGAGTGFGEIETQESAVALAMDEKMLNLVENSRFANSSLLISVIGTFRFPESQIFHQNCTCLPNLHSFNLHTTINHHVL
jgi:hypothetical protein